MSDLEALIAEVLDGHQREESGDWFRGSWVVITSCSCEKDYGVTDDEEYRAHVAAMLAPVIREREAEAWDACVHAAGKQWTIGHTSAQLLRNTNPYRSNDE